MIKLQNIIDNEAYKIREETKGDGTSCFAIRKEWTDGSLDYYFVDNNPEQSIKERTMLDVVQQHFDILLSSPVEWFGDEGVTYLHKSQNACEEGDIENALFLINNIDLPEKASIDRWLDSLQAHLRRVLNES